MRSTPVFNRWGYFLLAFFGWSLLTPALYVFGLDQVGDGVIVEVHEYCLYALGLPFLFYPFVKGYQFWGREEKAVSIGLILVGLLMPVVSGMFGIFFFEILARAWTGGKQKLS